MVTHRMVWKKKAFCIDVGDVLLLVEDVCFFHPRRSRKMIQFDLRNLAHIFPNVRFFQETI